VIVSRDVIVDERLAVAEKPGIEIDMGMEEDAAEAFLPAAQRRVNGSRWSHSPMCQKTHTGKSWE
jgi:hypothetical protein